MCLVPPGPCRPSRARTPCSRWASGPSRGDIDKITDCDVQEPAGAETLCCIKRVLHTVQVDTASGARGAGGGHELVIVGLEAPYTFKRDVWAMKRGDGLVGVPDSIVPVSMTRVEQQAKGSSSSWFGSGGGGAAIPSEVVGLLNEQNTLLKQAVGHLKTIANR